MRSLIYSLLTESASVTADVGNRVFSVNAIGIAPVSNRPDTPFIIVDEQPSDPFQEVRKTSRAVQKTFDIRAYDERGDYLRIDRILRSARDTLLSATLPATSPSGAVCIDIRWLGDGPDSDDPTFDMIFKAVTMRFVTNF